MERLIVLGLIGSCLVFLPACAHRNAAGPAAAVAAETGLPYAGFALGQSGDGGAVVLDVIAGPAALAGLVAGDRIDAAAGKR